jgi:hypothetical protein
VSSYSQFYEKEASYTRSLQNFGEIGVITNHADKMIRAKLADPGKVGMFLGYPESHANDTYHMWNLQTDRMILSWDVLWLNKSYNTDTTESIKIVDNTDALESPDLEAGRVLVNNEPKEKEWEETKEKEPGLNSHQVHKMRQLSGFFNPTAA